MDPSAPAPPQRLALYGALNLGFLLLVGVLATFHDGTNPRIIYLVLLFAMCSSPVLVVRKLNDRYALYTMFLFVYFVSYGVLDLASIAGIEPPDPATSLLDPAELLILLGGAVFILAYQWMASRSNHNPTGTRFLDDWPKQTLVITGLALWFLGTLATWYWNVRLTVRSLEVHNNVGELSTTLLMLGRYIQPLGILIIAYAYTVFRTRPLWLVTVAVVALQVVLGFISNTKGGAMLGGILVILTAYLVRGRLPKTWLLAGIVFITLAFPIFMAYRTVVVGEHGLTNAEAAQDLGGALQMAIAGQHSAPGASATSFFERSSVKSAVEMIVDRTGIDVPYQHGYTLLPLLTSLVPRLLWPNKLDVQTGVLVNEQFHLEQAVVYISPSHLGELYWNFGWPGALIGMGLIGILLGAVNRACDLSAGTSATRVLLMTVTIYQVGVRFEGSIASEYSVLARSLLVILILHWLFARRGLRNVAASADSAEPMAPTADFLPNLMRDG